jgi:hypothetical protein
MHNASEFVVLTVLLDCTVFSDPQAPFADVVPLCNFCPRLPQPHIPSSLFHFDLCCC